GPSRKEAGTWTPGTSSTRWSTPWGGLGTSSSPPDRERTRWRGRERRSNRSRHGMRTAPTSSSGPPRPRSIHRTIEPADVTRGGGAGEAAVDGRLGDAVAHQTVVAVQPARHLPCEEEAGNGCG